MGRIQPAGGVIDVGATMGDRLGKLSVEEGSQVNSGGVLADLESRALRELELKAAIDQENAAARSLPLEQQLANVRLAAADVSLKKAKAADLSVAAQKKKVALLEATLDLARRDEKRLKSLSTDLASEQERERQSLVVQQAKAELESAQAMLDQLVATSRLGVEAARLDRTAANIGRDQVEAQIALKAARIHHELAQAQYDRTQLTAPCHGTILKIYVRPGETIGNKPVLQLADLSRMVAIAEVYENEVQYIRPGQTALVSSGAIPMPDGTTHCSGTVTRVGQMIGAPALKSVDPFAPADRHVVEVRVELDDQGSRLARQFTNLQVDVRFPMEGRREKAEARD
jgi:HlyD family secretion protein